MSSVQGLVRETQDDFRRLVEETRRMLTTLFEGGGQVVTLQVEPNRPAEPQDFAFVGKTPEQKVQENYYRCSFCQTDRKFGAGRIVISRCDHRLRLIGDECWEVYINRDRYDAEVADYRAYTNRVAFEKIRGPLRDEVLRALRGLVRTMDQHGRAFEFVAGLSRMALLAGPDFQRLIREAARRNGDLTVERLVVEETSFREARRRDDGRPDAKPEPRRRWTTVRIGRLQGLASLLEQRTPWADANGARQAAIKARDLIEKVDWDGLTDRQAIGRIRQVRDLLFDVVTGLGRCHTAFNDAAALTAAASLGALQAWFRDPECDLQYEGRTEIHVTQAGFQVIYDGEPVMFHSPVALENVFVPETERLADLAKQLGV